MPVNGTSTTTVTGSFTRGVVINFAITDPADSYFAAFGGTTPILQLSGGGTKMINNGTSRQFVLPASGTDTVNFFTGAITGSETSALTYPATGGGTFTTTGINLLEFDLTSPGAAISTITLTPGASNGFQGPFGNTTIPFTIVGSDSTGNGGSCRVIDRSDSIGWPVAVGTANLVVKNADTINACTFTMTVNGQ